MIPVSNVLRSGVEIFNELEVVACDTIIQRFTAHAALENREERLNMTEESVHGPRPGHPEASATDSAETKDDLYFVLTGPMTITTQGRMSIGISIGS